MELLNKDFVVRIISANIPAPANKSTPSPPTTAADKTRPLPSEARDSYRKNSGPQVIDAEYVEFYTPSATLFNRERAKLDSTLEPEANRVAAAPQNDLYATSAALDKYQRKPNHAPPAGSFIDIFA